MLPEVLKSVTALLSCAAGLWTLLTALPCGFSAQEQITAYEPTAEEVGSMLHANTKYSWVALKRSTPRQPLCISLYEVLHCCAVFMVLLKGFVWYARTAHILHKQL